MRSTLINLYIYRGITSFIRALHELRRMRLPLLTAVHLQRSVAYGHHHLLAKLVPRHILKHPWVPHSCDRHLMMFSRLLRPLTSLKKVTSVHGEDALRHFRTAWTPFLPIVLTFLGQGPAAPAEAPPAATPPPPTPISIRFPVAGKTPQTAPITSVFDHSMSAPYKAGADGIVVAFTGDRGDVGPGSLSVKVGNTEVIVSWLALNWAQSYTLRCNGEIVYQGSDISFKHTGLRNGVRYRYSLSTLDVNGYTHSGLSVVAVPSTTNKTVQGTDSCDTFRSSSNQIFDFEFNGKYVGASSCGGKAFLSYEGHPGFDYGFPFGTPVSPAIGGVVSYTDNGAGKATSYNVLTLTSTDGSGYKVHYLHLSSYYDGATGKVMRVKTLDVACSPAEIEECPTCAQPGEVVSKDRVDPIGYVGNYSGTWCGVRAHLHFEVSKSDVPVDPYGWLGTGTDPYTRTVNTTLWETTPALVVQGTLDGKPWPSSGTGSLNYNINGPQHFILLGLGVPATTAVAPPGSYTATYISGGPPNSTLLGISPCAGPLLTSCTAPLAAGQSLSFTLNFASDICVAAQLSGRTNNLFWPSAIGTSLASCAPPPFSVSCACLPNPVSINQTTTCTSQMSGGTALFQYAWTTEGGSMGTLSSAFTSYSSSGTQTVNLSVTDSSPAPQTRSTSCPVQVNPAPLTATCSANPGQIFPGQSVTITTTPSGGTVPYQYSVNGGAFTSSSSESIQEPSSATPGLRSVSVIVKDSGASTTTATCGYAVVAPPTVTASCLVNGSAVPITVDTGTQLNFAVTASGGTSQIGRAHV